MNNLFMGVDVGTQGVRCVAADETGVVRAAASVPFEMLNIAQTSGWMEQSPEAWTRAAEECISKCVSQIDHPECIAAISVDGTSGTIVPLDENMRPLYNGVMYNDPRAREQASRVHQAMGDLERRLGYRFGASFSLPRILWFKEEMPEIYAKTRLFAHQADYITGLLCGEYAVSDYSNALKTGYDLLNDRWPAEFNSKLGIDIAKLPRIVRPGAPIANVSKRASERLGLSTRTLVTGGSSDGYASALAAGATAPGRWASILGTTFVLKGVTQELTIDPSGACYSHKLPDGWLLGGASNLGGRVLNQARGEASFDEMNAKSESLIPTGARCYPLTGRGERFPFVSADCEAFYRGDITGGRLYPAIMEGVGFAERMIYDHMLRIGCAVGDEICAAGGACRSDLWLRIRASILNRRLMVPDVVDAAMGGALLAASSHFGSLRAASDQLIHYGKIAEPDPDLIARYDDLYHQFLCDMRLIYGAEV